MRIHSEPFILHGQRAPLRCERSPLYRRCLGSYTGYPQTNHLNFSISAQRRGRNERRRSLKKKRSWSFQISKTVKALTEINIEEYCGKEPTMCSLFLKPAALTRPPGSNNLRLPVCRSICFHSVHQSRN